MITYNPQLKSACTVDNDSCDVNNRQAVQSSSARALMHVQYFLFSYESYIDYVVKLKELLQQDVGLGLLAVVSHMMHHWMICVWS